MIKQLLIPIAFVSMFATSQAQETKKEAEKTKMDLFVSKTGTITKFVETKLPKLKTTYNSCETKIRKIISGNAIGYFYQIEKQGQYGDKVASIEYSDLIEILKALTALKDQVNNDIASNPDYLENKFITVDGFQVGYYVSKGKATWYIRLEQYGSDATLFIDQSESIETAFANAKSKMDELKK